MGLKAAELGLDQIDDETMADLTAQADDNFETFIQTVSDQMKANDDSLTDEALREQSIAYLESVGYTQQMLLDSIVESYVDEQLYNYITADVAVTEEDVQAAYDALVAEQETTFASDSSYNSARNSGEVIAWNPEGYRAVKHVLIKFSDEQSSTYSDLSSTLDSLKAELEEAAAAQEPAEAPAEDEAAEDEAAEAEATEAPAEETEPTRTVEEITADIEKTEAELELLYAELLPTAQEVVDKFNAGTPFADLIAEYNEDPGMTNEPTATNGYAVAATSTTWDPAFTAGAMSIEAVGGISEPVRGSYGIHIIYYESDVPAGPVALDAIRADIEANALDTKLSEVYNTTIDEWLAAVNPVYHYDRLS